jgi:hypothetical protein
MLTKHNTEEVSGGLFLMSLFTTLWAIIAEYNLRGRDYWLFGVAFLIIVIVFVYNCFRFDKLSKSLPPDELSAEFKLKEKKKNKWFGIVFGLEGLAIFIVVNVLNNVGLPQYFIASFALIVGLHFFPIGAIYKRNFDYFAGTWTCLIAILGMFLIANKTYSPSVITAIIGVGCALATTSYGIRMVAGGYKLLK